jgi:DUF4097 and DUF4098 domain-containing protein YvlB
VSKGIAVFCFWGIPVLLRSRMVYVVPLALLLGGVGTALAQRSRPDDWLDRCRRDGWGGDARAHYCELRDTGLRPTGHAVTVDPGQNGGVRFTGWERDSVAVTAEVQTQAETDADARSLAQRIRIETSGGTIRAVGPAMAHGESWSVSFDVSVPHRSDLEAETENGPVSVADVTGRMELRAHNGPMHLESLGGDVHARTTNGPLVVTLEGDRWDGTGLDSETQNGPVVLTLPEHYSARLETGTVNGPMSVDYPLTLQGRISFRRIATDIGSGGPPIRAVTTNGPVTLRRR